MTPLMWRTATPPIQSLACIHTTMSRLLQTRPKCQTALSSDLCIKPLSDLPNLEYRLPQNIGNDSDHCNECNKLGRHRLVIILDKCQKKHFERFKHESHVNSFTNSISVEKKVHCIPVTRNN